METLLPVGPVVDGKLCVSILRALDQTRDGEHGELVCGASDYLFMPRSLRARRLVVCRVPPILRRVVGRAISELMTWEMTADDVPLPRLDDNLRVRSALEMLNEVRFPEARRFCLPEEIPLRRALVCLMLLPIPRSRVAA